MNTEINHVKKRNGRLEELDISKINLCAERACEGIKDVSASEVVLDAHVQFFDKITTKQIDESLIMSARAKIEKEPNYSYVAARLLLANIHKEVFKESRDKDTFDYQYKKSFIKNIKLLVENETLDPRLLEFDLKKLSESIETDRDLNFKFLGAQSLYDRYLIKIDGHTYESPQAFWMRVAMGLSIDEEKKEERAIEFYNALSEFRLCCSTPTLFNSGTTHSQLSSCYLNTFDDSIDGIFEGLWQEARKSKFAGGLGFDVSNFRASNSYVKGTNGKSSGLVPWLKIYNDTLIAVDQGGKRPGAGCAYLEPWHLDIEDFLELRKNTGDERRRCHDMNTANWLPDLFFRRIKEDGDWYLFSPSDARDLHEKYGVDFDRAYKGYCKRAEKGEIENFRKLKARDLWKKMLKSLFETGHPWITFKDNSNLRYSNAHEGVIHSSNLCTEIFLHTKHSTYEEGKKTGIGETAVCNLSSVNLRTHLNEDGELDFDQLANTIATQMRMLDNVIDINFYPTDESKNSNLKHRPVGAGTMGWSDVFHSYKIDFSSADAVKFSDELYEFVSYHAIMNSSKLSEERGSYSTYEGSLWSKGIFPADTYKSLMEYLGEKPISHRGKKFCPELNWKDLKNDVKQHGMRNSNTMAIAPTATISYIQGCAPCIEPDFSTLFTYENKSGNFHIVNEWFVKECKELGIWGQSLVDAIKASDGDVSSLQLPDELKARFRTCFDHDQLKLIEAAACRQKWIDMGQSLNLFYSGNSLKEINQLYMFARSCGLKATYYLRTKSASKIEKSTVDTDTQEKEEVKACSIVDPTCESCQ